MILHDYNFYRTNIDRYIYSPGNEEPSSSVTEQVMKQVHEQASLSVPEQKTSSKTSQEEQEFTLRMSERESYNYITVETEQKMFHETLQRALEDLSKVNKKKTIKAQEDALRESQIILQKPLSMISCFNSSKIRILILDGIDMRWCTSIRSICNGCKNLRLVSMKKWFVPRLLNCDFAFANCPSLELVDIDWEDIRDDINCFMTFYESSPKIISASSFTFNVNTITLCQFG